MSTKILSPPDVETALLLDRFMRRVHAQLNATAPEFDTYKVGPAGGMLLIALSEIEPAPIHALVDRLARDKSQITRVVRTFERKGLVQRTDDPGDGRVQVVALTDEGRAFVDRLLEAVSAAIAETIAPLSTGDQDDLRRLLRKI